MKLVINDKDYSLDIEDGNIPLLWILRDFLGLTGTKYSCGIGQCGACTVHVDGNAVRSCLIPVSLTEGKQITTIEGANSNDFLKKLQQNWIVLDVPQCGYCQSGQLMMASALLSQNPSPSKSDILKAMEGNLCRCGTYNRIYMAIEKTIKDLN